jgi:hypothetical protein
MSNRNKKSQAAMEFLMSYGWALLVVLLVIAALAYFGMLNPDRFLPDKITVSDNRIQLISTQSNGIIIKNAGSDTLFNLQINMTNHDCKISPANTIAPGEIRRLVLICNDPVTPNSRLKGDIKINYSSITYGEIMQKTATASYAVRGYYFSSRGLVAYYPLDSDTNDYSGNGNNGIAYGDTHSILGKINNGYSFDGSSDYIEMAQSASLDITQAVTLSAWVKLNSFGFHYGIFSYGTVGGGGGQPYSLAAFSADATPRDRFTVESNWGMGNYRILDTVSTVSTNTWYHIVGVYENGKAEIYLNGKLDSSTTGWDSSLILPNPRVLRIGDNHPGASEWFDGIIDEGMIFNRALSADEVKALYQSGR